ncbi:MAG: TIGR04255 family protein [Opitutaceae bacterium]|nr:TIGR04255 family protein [Opitutaceae bacterium]
MKRTLPALRLSKSPLVFVLGQVRFETILAMDKVIPEIQDELRLAGFTGYSERAIEIIRGTPDGKQTTERNPQWEFVHGDKRRSLLVDRGSVTCQTTNYTSYETFAEDLRLGLEVVERRAKPQQGVRVGLRYVDLIEPAEGKPLEWYVNRQLLGVPLGRFGERLGQSTESLIRVGEQRRLVARYTEAVQGLAFPVDLLPVGVTFRRPVQLNTRFALLDTDHFDLAAFAFSSAAVLERIASLHDTLDQVFRELINPNALKEWQ